MTEKPILFSEPMVRAILDNRKSQTRRVHPKQRYEVGDLLWVREPFLRRPAIHMPKKAARLWLDVTGVRTERLQEISEDDARSEGVEAPHCLACGYTLWDCKIQMDHWLCPEPDPPSAIPVFAALWNSINGKKLGRAWADNPWVWVYEFKRTEKPEKR